MSNKVQPLFLVLGGELASISSTAFANPGALDIVGFFTDRASAEAAWRGKAQLTVDQAQTRYFVLELHELLASKPSV